MTITKRLSVAALAAMLTTSAQAVQTLTVEGIMKEGWEIAGYTTGQDNRTSLVMFRHKEKSFLVQCTVLFDATRAPHTRTNCYEVR